MMAQPRFPKAHEILSREPFVFKDDCRNLGCERGCSSRMQSIRVARLFLEEDQRLKGA